jgi:hypothetical protein
MCTLHGLSLPLRLSCLEIVILVTTMSQKATRSIIGTHGTRAEPETGEVYTNRTSLVRKALLYMSIC